MFKFFSNITNEVKVGAFVFVTLMVFYMGFNFLKGKNIFAFDDTYYVKYAQTTGLLKSSPVIINGFRVGSVKKLKLNPDNPNEIIATLEITEKVSLPKGTVAKIVSSDLLGSKAVELVLSQATAKHESGDYLAGSVQASLTDAISKEVLPVKEKAEKLVVSLDSLVNELNKTLSKGQIEATLVSFRTTMGNLETTSKTINGLANSEASQLSAILGNVKTITKELEQNKDNFSAIAQNIHNITDTLAKAKITETINSLAATSKQLSGISTQINSGEGSLGMLLKDKTVYNNVQNATESLNSLLADFKQNPKRYVQFSLIERKKKE